MQIEVLPLLADNFSYVLHDDSSRATIIDPGEASPVLRFLRQKSLSLELILCTHHHPDHIGGAVELAKYFNCPIWVSKLDMERIVGATRGLTEADGVKVAGEMMRVLHVPGHTHGQISFYFAESEALFVGDTLFSLGCGRLFEGTPATMFASLKKLSQLPDSTKIYFGHEYTLRNGAFAEGIEPDNVELYEYLNAVEVKLEKGLPSTPALLGLEKRINPFLNTDSLEEWTRRRSLRNVF